MGLSGFPSPPHLLRPPTQGLCPLVENGLLYLIQTQPLCFPTPASHTPLIAESLSLGLRIINFGCVAPAWQSFFCSEKL